ncbi:MAG: phosphate ABC transporter substrate-binding protein, PhoT family [Chitinophagaceae bacterium]|nr:MAG: phosphate ABC transporter substrate-binding protein, PhoT family [Chitinophagaceae bacterium]
MRTRTLSKAFLYLGILMVLVVSCKPQKNKDPYDSASFGTINISVDESFKPVIEEQIQMYEASYPGTKIIAHYKPEADCIRDLLRDTATRTVIITRAISKQEEEFLQDSLKYIPGCNQVATDAVAIVLNISSTDTLFTLKRLHDQLTGKINRQQTIVFDGINATSTVRFITDSVLKGARFDTSVVKAAKSSKEVLDYVASSPNAIGLVGINWIGNPEVPEQVAMLKKVKFAYVECLACDSLPFVKPMQASILSRRYPLVRGLYYINKENYSGLGTGFVNFLKNERGQLIFRRAYLGPVMELGVRNLRLNEKIPNN